MGYTQTEAMGKYEKVPCSDLASVQRAETKKVDSNQEPTDKQLVNAIEAVVELTLCEINEFQVIQPQDAHISLRSQIVLRCLNANLAQPPNCSTYFN